MSALQRLDGRACICFGLAFAFVTSYLCSYRLDLSSSSSKVVRSTATFFCRWAVILEAFGILQLF